MQEGSVHVPELEVFIYNNWITEVLDVIKSGKEATVYRCRASQHTGAELLAAKLYRPRQQRSFKNDALYQDGRVILDRRIARAVAKKTRTGQAAHEYLWVDSEYEALQTLYPEGADVPRPYAKEGRAILMEYVGDSEQAAPPLRQVHLEAHEAPRLFRRLMDNVRLWLACNVVHGDLSAFNVLYWNGHVKVIDFPQAVDARFNHSAYDLLARDVGNICSYFARYGVNEDSSRIARSLWNRFRHGEL